MGKLTNNQPKTISTHLLEIFALDAFIYDSNNLSPNFYPKASTRETFYFTEAFLFHCSDLLFVKKSTRIYITDKAFTRIRKVKT